MDGGTHKVNREGRMVVERPLIGASPGRASDVIIFMTFRFKSNALLNGSSLCACSNLQRYFTSQPPCFCQYAPRVTINNPSDI